MSREIGRIAHMTHAELVARAVKWLTNTVRCQVAASELYNASSEIPDAMGWKSWASWLVECKTSRADFFRDQHKLVRRSGLGMGNFRYYMTPPRLVDPSEVPAGWGLLEVHPKIVRRVVDAEGQHHTEVALRERMALVSLLARREREATNDPR